MSKLTKEGINSDIVTSLLPWYGSSVNCTSGAENSEVCEDVPAMEAGFLLEVSRINLMPMMMMMKYGVSAMKIYKFTNNQLMAVEIGHEFQDSSYMYQCQERGTLGE